MGLLPYIGLGFFDCSYRRIHVSQEIQDSPLAGGTFVGSITVVSQESAKPDRRGRNLDDSSSQEATHNLGSQKDNFALRSGSRKDSLALAGGYHARLFSQEDLAGGFVKSQEVQPA